MAVQNAKQFLQEKLDKDNFNKLTAIANDKLYQFVADAIELTKPASVFVSTDKPEDIEYTRKQAIATGEEKPLKIKGHTIHFDGMEDQGRDREVTKYLVPKNDTLSKALNQIEREEGLAEVRGSAGRFNERPNYDCPLYDAGTQQFGFQHSLRRVHRFILRLTQYEPAVPLRL